MLNSLSFSIRRLAIGDALVADSGHRIERVDPGLPHEPCYCVSYGQHPYLVTPTSQPRDLDTALAFTDSFDWSFYDLPPIQGEWTRVTGGAAPNFFWRYGVGEVSAPDARYLTTPSPFTGALKRQMRVRALASQHLRRNRHGDIHCVYADQPEHSVQAEYPRYVVGRCYYPVERNEQRRSRLVRITAIHSAHLGDMTPADLADEGYIDFASYFAVFSAGGSVRLDTPVWVIETEPVFTDVDEYQASWLRPPRLPDGLVPTAAPLQLPLELVGA